MSYREPTDPIEPAAVGTHSTAATSSRQSRGEVGAPPNRFLWLLVSISVLLLARYFVPYFAEEIQYSLTRGRKRAEHELASSQLKQSGLADLSRAYQLVSERVEPSVVHINVAKSGPTASRDEFSNLFGQRQPELGGQGSGVIVDADGYVLTNYHVIRDATEIEVTLYDERIVPAQIVGIDPPTDIAVLKIPAGRLLAADWGDSDSLEVGALVWAIGSPFGLQHTITFGILSAKNRKGFDGNPYQDFLQTDAAVNPGNSGGPLVDSQGMVIGINTAIVGEAYRGISFAIPSSIARNVYGKIRSDGWVERGWLGVQLADATVRVPGAGQVKSRGALVEGVVNGTRIESPAQAAGIRVGDIVVEWDGQEVTDAASLSRLVAASQVNSTVEVVLDRSGQRVTVMVTIGVRPTTFR